MINFETDENLGQMVSNVELQSFGLEPMTKFSDLVFAAGGYNVGYLCGFKFTSNEPHKNKEFYIAFVNKIRSKIYHQAVVNPSQWFLFYKPTPDEIQIVAKSTFLHLYNFDVSKFFKSDYFIQNVPKLKKYVLNGLDIYLKDFVEKHGEEIAKGVLTSSVGHAKDALVKDSYQVYEKSIREGLKLIDSTKFNDKDYHRLKKPVIDEKEKNLKEDNLVSEDSGECYIKQENINEFSVYTKKDNTWLATFADENIATIFANNYPKMKNTYIKKQQENEIKQKMLEKKQGKKLTEHELLEKELDDKIEEALKEIYC